jgi:hypothetical protein
MQDNNGAKPRRKGRFFRARITRRPAGWYITPLEGDTQLFERLWGSPVAELSEEERHTHPEMDVDAFKKELARVANNWGIRLDWVSLVEFELRPIRKPKPKPPAYETGQVNNLVELAEDAYEGVEDWRAMPEKELTGRVERLVYKYTDCGAWFNVLRDEKQVARGVQVGSIVEGIEPTTETHTLMFPFAPGAFMAALQAVEDEAAALWNDTHGCSSCWDGPKNDEDWPIDEDGDELIEWPVKPDCPECHGHGRII